MMLPMNAADHFRDGYNCAQAVFLTHAPRFDIDPDLAQRLAAPLGGGIGGLRRTCGALTALCLLAGLKHGGYDPNNLEAKTEFYARIQDLEAQFTATVGTSICAELLAQAECDASGTPSARTDEYYATRPCVRCVALADQLAKKLLSSQGAPPQENP